MGTPRRPVLRWTEAGQVRRVWGDLSGSEERRDRREEWARCERGGIGHGLGKLRLARKHERRDGHASFSVS